MKHRHPVLIYLIKFIGAFILLYVGTQAIIGLSASGGYYNNFVDNYLDYPTQLRNSLLYGAKGMLDIFGIDSYVHDTHYLRMPGGRGVRMVYSCLGVGLLSFWTAFVYANKGTAIKKTAWIIGGLFTIWLINITRVALLLVATNKNWHSPLNLDNHTLFNIAAYTAIFCMIWRFDRSQRKAKPTHPNA